MNRNDENGFHQTQVVEEPSEQITGGPPPSENGNVPYVPQKQKAKPSLKENSRLLVIGAGIVLVLLLLAFNGISRRSSAPKTSGVNPKQPQTQSPNSGRAAASITPILDTGRSPAQGYGRQWGQPGPDRAHRDQIGEAESRDISR